MQVRLMEQHFKSLHSIVRSLVRLVRPDCLKVRSMLLVLQHKNDCLSEIRANFSLCWLQSVSHTSLFTKKTVISEN